MTRTLQNPTAPVVAFVVPQLTYTSTPTTMTAAELTAELLAPDLAGQMPAELMQALREGNALEVAQALAVHVGQVIAGPVRERLAAVVARAGDDPVDDAVVQDWQQLRRLHRALCRAVGGVLTPVAPASPTTTLRDLDTAGVLLTPAYARLWNYPANQRLEGSPEPATMPLAQLFAVVVRAGAWLPTPAELSAVWMGARNGAGTAGYDDAVRAAPVVLAG